jgi:hypothetical protein
MERGAVALDPGKIDRSLVRVSDPEVNAISGDTNLRIDLEASVHEPRANLALEVAVELPPRRFTDFKASALDIPKIVAEHPDAALG